MIKNKTILLASCAILFAGVSSPVMAVDISTEANISGSVNLKKATTTVNATSSAKIKTDIKATTTTEVKATTTKEVKANATSTDNRSVVGKYVQGLVHVADREKGIGADVRVIAQAQDESATTTQAAVVTIEKRSKLKTFLFGTDYKNIGVLRSELARTDNRIAKLEVLAAGDISSESKTELEAQIAILKADQVKIQQFIEPNEGKFSLFGWFMKK
jgi:hypothetical protein